MPKSARTGRALEPLKLNAYALHHYKQFSARIGPTVAHFHASERRFHVVNIHAHGVLSNSNGLIVSPLTINVGFSVRFRSRPTITIRFAVENRFNYTSFMVPNQPCFAAIEAVTH
jgi:hypothetical protein